jgi:hypothetical protein
METSNTLVVGFMYAIAKYIGISISADECIVDAISITMINGIVFRSLNSLYAKNIIVAASVCLIKFKDE